MNLKLEVLLSASIKQKRPWPHLHWIGQEKEAILLSDDQRLSVLTLSTGRTQRKIPKLQPLLKNVLSVATSANGTWLAGVLTTGELFLWKKDGDCLKTVGAVERVCTLTAAAQESVIKLFLFVTNNGKRVLLVSQTGEAFLWESTEQQDLPSVPGPRLSGLWAQILPNEQVRLPQGEDKESAVHAVFITDEVLGDCCFCSFAFISGDALVLTTLQLKWFEQVEHCISAVPFSVQWTTQTHVLGGLSLACQPVKSRGALLTAFSGDGLVLAVVINQNDPKATQVLFVNPVNGVTVSSSLQGCGSSVVPVPARFIRSYWVGGVSWTQDALFLACVLKRGAVLLLSRLGELVTLTTSGCSVEFGPAEFIPLHPLITYRQPLHLDTDPTQSTGSSASESDPMRQRFSLAAHPCLPCLIVSDGYMFTVLRFAEHTSASSLLKTLLLEVTQGLEDVRNQLMSSEGSELKCRLPPMTSLRRSVLQGWGTQEPGTWTPPPFLKKSEGDEAEEGDESEEDAPCPTNRPRAHSSMDQGRLEFASMFDTLHAKQGEQTSHLEAKFRQIQNSLLLAWSMGMSVKEIEGRDLLLQYTVRAMLQFARLLPFAPASLPSSVVNVKGKLVSKVLRRSPGIYRTLQLLRYCLTVLYWDSVYKHSLTHVVSLSSGIVKLILSRKLGAASFSQSLLSSLLVLKLSSLHLNAVYSLQSGVYPDLPRNVVSSSLQAADPGHKLCNLTLIELPTQTVQTVQEPSHRLAFTWRLLYQHVLQHHSHLRKLQKQSNRGSTRKKLQREATLLTSVLSQAQAALQTMGERLGPRLQLKPLMGEEHFLLGSYLESVQTWKTALQEEVGRGGRRLIYLQTRYSLAILYTHLYLYNLSAAQDLCEHLVRHMLSPEQTDISPGPSVLGLDVSLGRDVGDVAAVAVVQSLARFMALYFTNQPLYVLPPHHIDVLPPLHCRPGCLPRLVPVQRSHVAAAVREQQLSAGWSVERAVELLLLGRLIPEAVWMALTLGDWKTAVVLGLAFNLYSRGIPQAAWGCWRSLHLSRELHPSQIFQDKLQALLGHAPKSGVSLADSTMAPSAETNLLTDSIEEEDADLMFSSVQEILKAAVMADADVLTETFDLLMQTAKNLAVRLPGLVPDGLYLPAPPLYCPQPASVSEGSGEDLGLSRERETRQKLSGVLQRLLLLFRAARCSLPAAHWYIGKLRHGRKIMNKIRGKCGLSTLRPFPNSLLQYGKVQSSFFRPGAGGDGTSSAIPAKVVGSFRDLCGLCWMFHVREQLSERCRKYQMARDNARSTQDCELAAEYDAAVVDHCLASLEWACRMLPFARFMNVEELIQDVILSLVNELPPIRKVAEVVLRAFPDVEDVRVPLRDKHHTLQQRLRHSTVQGPDGGEMMSIVLHELYRQRMKMLKRVGRNIGPSEQHIWERAEEGLREQEDEMQDQFSLGTSLSRSTLTDTWRSQNQSEGDTTDNMSVELQDVSERQSRTQQRAGTSDRDTQPNHHRTLGVRDGDPGSREATACRMNGESEGDRPQLPLVGSWEFERDDEEYVTFLELFLSYLLERDQVVNESPNVPLLTCCSRYLREQELNSLAFHVQSTLKRRQGRVRMSEDVSIAKSSSSLTSDLYQNESGSCGGRTKAAVFSPVPGALHSTSRPQVPLVEHSLHSCFPTVGAQARGRASGLFGSRLRSPSGPLDVSRQWGTVRNGLPAPAPAPVVSLLNEDLTPELEARFPDTANLLEWMIRWSERRLLYGPYKVERLPVRSSTIRVRTSVTAILHSLWLLDKSLGIDRSHLNYHKDSEEECAVDRVCQPKHHRLKLGKNPGSSRIPGVGCETDTGRRVEPFQHSDHAEDFQRQDLGDANLYSTQDLTSDSDSRTDEEESGDGERRSPQDQGGKVTVARGDAYEEEEPRPCTPISPYISINIKTKPRARIRDRVTVGSDLDAEGALDEPIRMDPGEKVDRSLSTDPREYTGTDPRDQTDKHTSTDRRERIYKSTGTDRRERMDKPTGTDRRERMDKLTGTDRREGMDKLTGTDRRERMDKPINMDPGERLNGQQTASPGLPPGLVCPSLEQAVLSGQSMPEPQSVPVTDARTGAAATQAVPAVGQGTVTSDMVRYLLQDEVFKLVQLQQINFLSLMQVVGSSLLQVPGTQPPQSVLSQNCSPPAPSPSTNPPPTGRPPAPGEQERKKVPAGNGLPLPTPSGPPEEKVAQSPEDLPVRPRPEDAGVSGLRRIPETSSVALLQPQLLGGPGAHWQPAPSLPLLRLQPGCELRAPPVSCGKLPFTAPRLPPAPREAWAPPTYRSQPGLPPHLNSAAYKAETARRAEQGERREGWVNRDLPTHLNLDQYQPGSCSNQLSVRAARSQTPPPHIPYPQQMGLPLLHFPQPTHTTLFPLTARLPLARPLATQRKPPAVLLQCSSRCPEPQVSALHPPRLVPAQDIIAFEQGRLRRAQRSSGSPQAETFHLLRVNLQPFEPRTQRDGKKRLKRRERSAEKTPAPEQCVSGPDLPPPPAESREEPAAVPPEPDPSQCCTVPAGPSVSLSPDWDSGSCLFATAAELHYLASTRKNAEERKDASTNTDQGPEPQPQTPTAPKSFQDAGILTCSEMENHPPTAITAVEHPPVNDPQLQALPPDVFVNLRFPSEVCPQPLSPPANGTAPDQVLPGHRFLTVIDIDAGELLSDLPATTAVTEPLPSLEGEAMSVPALHLMAASVTNAVPPDTCPLQESRPAGSVQSGCEDWEQKLAGDELTQRLLQKGSSPVWTPPQASAHAAHQVRAQLSEMEHQLSALQDIAVNMEQDFANTKMLINTIEQLGSAIDPQGLASCSDSALAPDLSQLCVPTEDGAADWRSLRVAPGSCGFGDPQPLSPLPFTARQAVEDRHEPQLTAGWCERLGSRQNSPARATAEDCCYPRVLAAAAALGSGGCEGSPCLRARPGFTEEEPKPVCYPKVVIAATPGSHGRGGSDLRTPPHFSADDTPLSAAHHGPIAETESPTDERLGLSGLSGVSDIIGDLINEGKLSAEAVGLSEGQARHLSRCSKVPKRTEQERKEIQEWMKCKRRQRLEAYLEHRDELRERERRPYFAKEERKTFTSREIKENQKRKTMKKRVTLAENHEQRARAALSLMNEMLCDSVRLPTSQPRARAQRPLKSAQHTQSHTGSTARGRGAASRSLSAGRTPQRLLGTFSLGRAPSFSSSPGRVVRAVRQRPQDQLPAEDLNDSDSLSHWSPPEHIRDILDREPDSLLQGAEQEVWDAGAEGELCEVRSDSTGTLLCNLDWSVVNSMVGSVGPS